MLLPISSIKPAPDPIRKTWDEDKLNELAQSIAEQGLIVPIKVRPHPELEKWVCHKHGYAALSKGRDFDEIDVHRDCLLCDELLGAFWGQDDLDYKWFEYEEGEIQPARPFEVVYGHRRLEAVRRVGVTEIEVIVEGVDDTNALVQALIENIQREDMAPIDRAMAINNLRQQTGWSENEVARRGIMPRATMYELKIFLDEYDQGLVPESAARGRVQEGSGVKNTVAIRSEFDRAGIPGDVDTRKQVAEKVEREQLNYKQARRLAQSVVSAPSPEAKKMLLDTEYSPVIHDPENIKARAQTYGAHDPFYRTDNGKTQQKTWDNAPEVKMIIDGVINAARAWTTLIAEIRRMVEVGKMAPEGRQFTATKLRSLAQTLSSFADELEQEKELEHA